MSNDVDLTKVWLGVAAEVWRRPPGRVERLLARGLRSSGLARALVATPSLLLPWVLASISVLGIGAVLTLATGFPLVPLLAPAVAAAAIAYAYGPGADQAFELTRTAAVGERMILLVRVVAVFGLNAGSGLVFSLLSAHAAEITYGWLLPMTAVAALSLAVATAAGSAITGTLAGLSTWAMTVLGAQTTHSTTTAPVLIILYVLIAVGGAAVVLLGTRTPRKGIGVEH